MPKDIEAKQADDDQVKQDAQDEYVELLNSEIFLQDSARVYGYVDKIASRRSKIFASQKYDFYSDFYRLFQPGKELSADYFSTENIQAAVTKILSNFGSKKNQDIVRGKHYDQEIHGLLYAKFQTGYGSPKIYSKEHLIYALENEYILPDVFPYANIIFSTSSKRSYKERKELSTAGRIVIHLSMLPKDFWASDMAINLVGSLIDIPSVCGIKVRSTAYFDRGDTILIYTATAPEPVWPLVKDIVTKIIPQSDRSKYLMPFSTPLDVGINANIPIYYIASADGRVKKASFTEGVGILGRMAYLQLLNVKSPYDEDHVAIFQGILSALFKKNNLRMTKNGVLCQPGIPPQGKAEK